MVAFPLTFLCFHVTYSVLQLSFFRSRGRFGWGAVMPPAGRICRSCSRLSGLLLSDCNQHPQSVTTMSVIGLSWASKANLYGM